MKTKLSILLLTVSMLSACHKDDVDDAIDCIGDSLLTFVTHSADAGNSKKIDFTVTRSSDPKIKSIEWNFGDNATTSSNSSTISHTYAAAGSYQVKLKVSLENGCSHDKTENITVK